MFRYLYVVIPSFVCVAETFLSRKKISLINLLTFIPSKQS